MNYKVIKWIVIRSVVLGVTDLLALSALIYLFYHFISLVNTKFYGEACLCIAVAVAVLISVSFFNFYLLRKGLFELNQGEDKSSQKTAFLSPDAEARITGKSETQTETERIAFFLYH